MRRSTAVFAALATALAALVAASAALAGGPGGKTLYRYVGQVKATGGSSLTVTVQNGNRAALRSLLGQSQEQAFTTDAKTVFLKWTGGKPATVGIADLAVGDHVAVNVRADRSASLDTIRGTPAALVGDHGQTIEKPTQPLYLFRGTFVSAGGGAVTVDVKGGNRLALRLLIGQTARQTFATGGETVFLRWAGRIPTVIDASMLKEGDRVVVRVRAPRDATLQVVASTAAKRVAAHEPRAQESTQSAQS
jgi:uncharacterized protein (DUF58 family)